MGRADIVLPVPNLHFLHESCTQLIGQGASYHGSMLQEVAIVSHKPAKLTQRIWTPAVDLWMTLAVNPF